MQLRCELDFRALGFECGPTDLPSVGTIYIYAIIRNPRKVGHFGYRFCVGFKSPKVPCGRESIHLSVGLSIYPSVCLSVYLSIDIYIYIYRLLFVSLFIGLLIYLFIYIYVYALFIQYTYRYTCVHLNQYIHSTRILLCSELLGETFLFGVPASWPRSGLKDEMSFKSSGSGPIPSDYDSLYAI